MSGITPAPPRDRHGIAIQGLQTTALLEGWELAQSAPGEHDHRLVGCGSLIPARAPGTVGSALVAAGADPDSLGDLDADDWWFRHRFASRAGGGREKTVLRLDGLATIAEVWLNGTQVLASDNMFRRHVIPVDDLLEEENELMLGFRALAPLLVDRKPRPRWRTRVVQHQALRRHRTTIFGRAAGFAPGPAPVGRWRLVALERSTTFVVDQALIRPSLERNSGVLRVKLVLRAVSGRHPESARVALDGPTGSTIATLAVRTEGPSIVVEGTAEIPHVQPWWPHTHGDPAMYRVLVTLSGQQEETTLDAGEVGFRSIDVDDPGGGFALRINGASVFCRGGALTPDRLELDRSDVELRALLTRVRDAGMNMIRLSGIGVYGDDLLYRLCDELGLLVWQDFAFANMDYPADDAEFSASVEAEAAGFLEPAGRHASLAVLCGGSEVEQQAAMMGIPPRSNRTPSSISSYRPRSARPSSVPRTFAPRLPGGLCPSSRTPALHTTTALARTVAPWRTPAVRRSGSQPSVSPSRTCRAEKRSPSSERGRAGATAGMEAGGAAR